MVHVVTFLSQIFKKLQSLGLNEDHEDSLLVRIYVCMYVQYMICVLFSKSTFQALKEHILKQHFSKQQ